jgi:phage head maturation protease
MEFQFAIQAAEFEMFAPGAFDRTIGQDVAVRMPDGSTAIGTVVAVDATQTTAQVTISMEGDVGSLASPLVPGSVGFI